MNENRIKLMIEEIGTDISGKWMSINAVNKLIERVLSEAAFDLDEPDRQRIFEYFGITVVD